MSNNLRDEKLSHGNGEPAAASEPNPDPKAAAGRRQIPGDEPKRLPSRAGSKNLRPGFAARRNRRGNRNQATGFAARSFWLPRR